MIRIIPLLLSFLLFFSVTELHASAAEKWEYEPVMKDMNIHVKGYKVDQYGNAVNDYEYNTKIDPKTTANKQKMGTVGFGRLLKSTGWGLLGAAALEALLESVDWVLDPEAQSIWRNKKPNSNGSVNCSGGFQFKNDRNAAWFNCPLSAVEDWIKYANTTDPNATYKFLRFDSDPYTSTPILYTVRYEHHTYPSLSKDMPNQQLTRKLDPNAEPSPKEYLTPEALADYANHTHSDYADPQLAPKLEPKYSPNIATDLWKPSNNWEKDNSPTVQEVNNQLNKTNPEPIKPPEITPNPETGGSVLPSFCSWAVTICDFINWFKESPDSPEAIDVPEKELEKKEIKKDLITANVSSCPADIHFDVQNLPFGIKVNKGVQMQPICNTIEPLKYVFQLFTLVLCGFILLRV